MSGFVFQWAEALLLLLLVLPLAWLLNDARQRRAALIKTMGGGISTHRRLRDVLRLLAFALLVLAMARPGYSPQRQALSQTGRDVVFALDVSQSMLAQDVSPSRLELAKQAIRDALQSFSNERVALVVYAGSATILCPLTYDYDFVRYMLEQAHPRSADFGGTSVQSAVEKVVGQVLMPDRTGVQDLIVLTDGGDNGSQMSIVAQQLEENSVDLLLLGIGDPDTGSPIPITDNEGAATYLRSQESVVYTQLDDASLRDLAELVSGSKYFPVGVRPFDLGQIYADYAVGRAVSAPDGDSGIIVYQEAALFFILPALILLVLSECWGVKGLQFGRALLFVFLLGCLPKLEAMNALNSNQYQAAKTAYTEADFSEAAELFSEIAEGGKSTALSSAELATVQFNLGLSLIKLSQREGADSAIARLSYAQRAQTAFLAASCASGQLQRAALRLEATDLWMAELQQRIDAEAEADDALASKLQALIERLQAHLKAQQTLRQRVVDADVDRRQPKRARDASPPEPLLPPEDVAQSAVSFVSKQKLLEQESVLIDSEMQRLNVELTPPPTEGLPEMESLLAEPLKLMASVAPAMQRAAERLSAWESWPAARSQQAIAIETIEAILALLSTQSSDDAEAEDYDSMLEDEDYEYSDESSESIPSSMRMESDYAAGGEMQSLPLPNYSAEEILMEEQGNLQFRQQQRAAANAGKVEKDY